MQDTSTAASTAWPAGLVIRTAAEPDASGIEVADVVTGRRTHWQPQELAEAILDLHHAAPGARAAGPWGDPRDTGADRAALVSGWKHWLARGWHPSDRSYIASRRPPFDTGARAVPTGDDAPREELPDGPAVPLGAPPAPGDRSLGALLAGRRSGRSYVPRPAPLASLSGLLWHGLAGVRASRGRPGSDGFGLAWDVHVTSYNVAGLDAGVYRYDLERHRLLSVRPGDHREAMCDILQGMRSPASAAWTIGLVADLARYQWRHRDEHALRRLWSEAGLVGQELVLLGSAYGLGTLVTPAQKDRPYLRLHRVDDRRYTPVYTLTMGLSRGRTGVEFTGGPAERVPGGDS